MNTELHPSDAGCPRCARAGGGQRGHSGERHCPRLRGAQRPERERRDSGHATGRRHALTREHCLWARRTTCTSVASSSCDREHATQYFGASGDSSAKLAIFLFFTAAGGLNQVKSSSLAGLLQGTRKWLFLFGFFWFHCRKPVPASARRREEYDETRVRFQGAPADGQGQDELQGTATMRRLLRHHLPFLFLPNQLPFETQSCHLQSPRITALVRHLYYHLAKVPAPDGILCFLRALSSHSRGGNPYWSG